MLNGIFIFFGFVYIGVGFVRFYKTWKSLRWIARYRATLQNTSLASNRLPYILIIVPLLREGKIVERTVQHFSALEYPRDKCKIVFVTTEREFEADNNESNTIDLLKRAIQHLSDERVQHVHYPKKTGIKSDQLNYAVRKLEQMFPRFFNEATYIGVYDADSRTPSNTLYYTAKTSVFERNPDLLQQPTLYLGNRNEMSMNVEGLLARAFSWLQTGYAFYVENYNLITYKQKQKKLIYAVGHGFFVRWVSLKKINYFPSPIEDTRLGHIFSYLGYSMKLIPVFDVAEVAKGFMVRTVQASVWFVGVTYYLKDLRIARSVNSVNASKSSHMPAYRFYRNAVWVISSFIVAAVLVYLTLFYPILAAVMFFVFFVLPHAFLMMRLRVLNNMSTPAFDRSVTMKDVLAIFISPIEYLRMSLGPILGLIKVFLLNVKNEKQLFPKTER